MSDLSTTYIHFSAIDFKGENVLSAYSLSGTPLQFRSDLNLDSSIRCVWAFGDDTTYEGLTALKYYDYPGEYTVNLFAYDCYGNSLLSVFSRDILILPYEPIGYVTATTSITGMETGKFYEFDVKAFYPPFQPISNIYCNVSGSNSLDYFAISSNKYNHLQKQHSFYDQIYNFQLSAYEYKEIQYIELDATPLFGYIENGSITLTQNETSDTFFVGTSGQKTISYKDDSESDKLLLSFTQDKNNQIDYITSKIVDYLNLFSVTLSSGVIENQTPTELSITSNGLDGENTPSTSFSLKGIKFEDTKIPFVIKLKDDEWYTVKDFDSVELSAIQFTLLSANFITDSDGLIILDSDRLPIFSAFSNFSSSYYTISSLNNTLSSIDHNSSFRGYVKFNDIPNVVDGVRLSATATLTKDTIDYDFTGVTTEFILYPKDHFVVSKVGEDFDMKETIKDLRFQEFLLDDEIMFDDFIGNVVGDINSSSDTIGKKIYEKIHNFVENHVDLNVCDINSLISLSQMMDSDANVYDKDYINSPEKLKRILNLASISKNKLLGTKNQFSENFDIKGYSTKEIYGKNIGDEIDVLTFTISSGTPIVALEKFSNRYSILNTYQPISGFDVTSYPLSTYNSDWGWPLVLPSSFDIDDIDKYYKFFEYVESDKDLDEFVIDPYSSLTTTPSAKAIFENISDNHIFENMIINTIFDKLSVFGS